MGLACWFFALLRKMPLGSDPIAVTNTAAAPVSPSGTGSAPRKALAVKKKPSKPKGPARPYKKTESETIKMRIGTMKKKIAILESKAVILRDRLEMHEAEVVHREDAA